MRELELEQGKQSLKQTSIRFYIYKCTRKLNYHVCNIDSKGLVARVT
jgi:hypothetical protein